MSYNDDVCIKCEKRPIQNKFHKLCSECNFERTHSGVSRFMVYKERSLKRQKENKNKPLKVKPYVYKKTGERDLFLEIWNERPHYCEKGSDCINSKNGIGVWLGNEPKVWMFSHIKPKSTHPELRLVKGNIELICYECHYKHEFQ